MKRQTFCLITAIALIMSACAKKIDSTSEESMQKSIKEIKSSLSKEKKKKFEQSLKLVMFHGFDFDSLMKEGGTKKNIEDIRKKLDGMTADDVIAKGEKIKTEIEKEKKRRAKKEINKLYEKKKTAEKHKKKLKQFKIQDSKFYKRKTYMGTKPIMQLTVKNGTEHAISRAYFNGKYYSPNRSVPWHEEEFNYKIPGGLEPGEQATWKLSPSMLSDWSDVEIHKNAEFKIDVLRLDGADGEKLYSVKSFDENNRERLKELLKKYPEFAKNR